MAHGLDTVEDRLRTHFDTLTRAERQLAAALLENYPAAGLASITAVADAGAVSTPTVARLVKKLGFDGFGEFQQALRDELSAKMSTPIRKHEEWAVEGGSAHILHRFADAAMRNLQQTLGSLDLATFDAAVAALADPKRRIYLGGGRITRALADYLFTHLQVIRSNVTQLGAAPGVWPHYVLEMKPGDLVILFDIRRYETMQLRLAELARERDAEIVLLTDQWRSPIAKHAQFSFSCNVTAPSAWDSSIALMLIAEALIAAVQEQVWEQSRGRMEELEEIFDRTRLFRKFT